MTLGQLGVSGSSISQSIWKLAKPIVTRFGRLVIIASLLSSMLAGLFPTAVSADTSPTLLGVLAEAANWGYQNAGGLAGQYTQGIKHLGYISVGSEFLAGGEVVLYIDLDDYYSSLHPNQAITGEGSAHWITMWVDAGISFVSASLPVGMGIVEVPMSGEHPDLGTWAEADPNRAWAITGPSYCGGIGYSFQVSVQGYRNTRQF